MQERKHLKSRIENLPPLEEKFALALAEIEKEKYAYLKDNNGGSSMAEGKKYDKDKLRMDLLPTPAIKAMAACLGYGAKKYDAYNWTKGIKHSRLYAATLRHLFEHWGGNDNDDESKLPHLWHALTNIAMMISLPSDNDRPLSYKKVLDDYIAGVNDEST